ncbi:hypothetical protein VITFI_CDS0628 [Vitreoscilla filiformis]|jgi:hypothetical protein|uniref:Uncharacterized protein n=1 Tax=Vitreoscilla filiformis TaxID=63 RepID=A0A221KC53_VITFI|nr:hypothetical protein [Vitreoscilla filiformis]ASM76407.1 hypothetical protein VITFI_CDS0628 [Vitreoscilla filiformis]
MKATHATADSATAAVTHTTAPVLGLHVCPCCSAVQSLSAVIADMINDDEVRRYTADILAHSIPLGGLVIRYLDLHVPPKQRIRLPDARALLAELVPDMRRNRITRHGREWQAPEALWFAALRALFDQADAGSLTLPLKGNAYLYSILVNKANDFEAKSERAQQEQQRHRPAVGQQAPVPAVAAAPAMPRAMPPAVPYVPPKDAIERARQQLGRKPHTAQQEQQP